MDNNPESRNKDNRIARLNHARKLSRGANISDCFDWLMATSDPYYTETRRRKSRKGRRGRKKKQKIDKRKRKICNIRLFK